MSELRVALTFDAEHPSRRQCSPGVIEQILATLVSKQVRASFFLQGRWATAYPSTARAVADDGHLIGNHSHWHAPMPMLTEQGMLTDVQQAQQGIIAATGVDPRPWFRCPFGEGADDRRVLGMLHSFGYRNIHWNVAGSDWLDDRSATDLEEDLLNQTVRHGDGAVVLLHTWPAPSAAALPGLIERIRTAGARFVTVDEIGPDD